ncbi:MULTISPECIES: hypothetical protein [unclassified Brevundimonas]|uniref:hypothetical protein n=1 Tax=unclassified Brevundimonas TaxID=2622653 RepID=UPI0025C6320D|nr:MULTISPECIES: hypothetical protein [unclassified Brevundimonas]
MNRQTVQSTLPAPAIPAHIIRGPAVSRDIRFALLPSLAPGARATVFATLEAMESSIHRRRDGQAIELSEIEDVETTHRSDISRVIEIWALDVGNDRDRLIGFAYLAEKGRAALEAALHKTRNAYAQVAA